MASARKVGLNEKYMNIKKQNIGWTDTIWCYLLNNTLVITFFPTINLSQYFALLEKIWT